MDSKNNPNKNDNNKGQGTASYQKTTEDNGTIQDDFIDLFGDDDLIEPAEGEPIHDSLAQNWLKIVQKGLPYDTKKELQKAYPIPKNCITLNAPKLNDEIKTILGTGRKKDQYQAQNQTQLGVAIGIIGKALTLMMKKHKPKDVADIFEPIKDACRLLTDIHFNISKTRRAFVLPALDAKGRLVAEECLTERKLFGEDFTSKLQKAQEAQKTAKTISKKDSYASKGETHNSAPAVGGPQTIKLIQEVPNSQVTPEVSYSAGRLKDFVRKWKTITLNPYILSCIKGHKIPFSTIPCQKETPGEPKMSKTKHESCEKAIKELIKKGAISECEKEEGDFFSTYFLRKKSSGEDRFIFNLKKLNEHINTSHFKIENLKNVLALLSKNDYMASIDIKDAFLSIPIAEEHKKYLKFQFSNKVYRFEVLAFGLSPAPYVFTKVMKPLLETLRSKGFKSVAYIDDLLLIGRTEKECQENVEATCNLLKFVGFELNKKCQLSPQQKIEYLGFEINSVDYSLSLTHKKIGTISNAIKTYKEKEICSIRDTAKLIGILIAACSGLRYGWVHTKILEREKYLALARLGENFDADMSITNEMRDELSWWQSNIYSAKNEIRDNKYSETYTYSFNIYRSALSLLSMNEISKDAGISRYLKGISNQKPQKAKYNYIWSPKPAIEILSKNYPNEDLTLETLTKKVATLLVLTTAQRIQTLSKIEIENIEFHQDTLQIKVPSKIKTSGRNRYQPFINIKFFQDKPNICVAKTIQVYLNKTSELRGQCKTLFITHKKPFHAATSQTISRWIRETLESAGINTEIFTAHSTRHAATSAAARRGFDIETIR
uniref:Reverse transcriptase domain-containing protein n=1 Tax=Trichogramma kaykai TaxID=54128 RepID=A0ABD2WM07_9HYME